MAWNDKPTENQVYALYHEDAASLLDAAENAKERGAYKAADALEKFVLEGHLLAAVKLIDTRKEISTLIGRPCTYPKIFAKPVEKALLDYTKDLDFDFRAFL